MTNVQAKNQGGRPVLSEGEATKYVGTKVPEGKQKRLVLAAKALDLTMSDVVRSALDNWLTSFDKAVNRRS